jgi:hypothetical protein
MTSSMKLNFATRLWLRKVMKKILQRISLYAIVVVSTVYATNKHSTTLFAI